MCVRACSTTPSADLESGLFLQLNSLCSTTGIAITCRSRVQVLEHYMPQLPTLKTDLNVRPGDHQPGNVLPDEVAVVMEDILRRFQYV